MKALLERPSDLPSEELFKKDVAGLYPPLGLLSISPSARNGLKKWRRWSRPVHRRIKVYKRSCKFIGSRRCS